jgi:gamma-glutamylcyclotransferase (GGCT)/AIG2-like uncharacterized protein YtfP
MESPRRTRSKKDLSVPSTPMVRIGFRDADHVRSVVFRMGKSFIARLDELCKVNGRSRREVVEILISEASLEFRNNSQARITPMSEH